MDDPKHPPRNYEFTEGIRNGNDSNDHDDNDHDDHNHHDRNDHDHSNRSKQDIISWVQMLRERCSERLEPLQKRGP